MSLMIAINTTTNLKDAMAGDDAHVRIRTDFDTFVRSTYPGLVGVATALTGTLHDAEDMVQDTMLKAFVHWKRIRDYEHPQGWAHRVLVNRCRGWWRRRRSEANYLASLRRQESVTPGPSPAALAFWQAVRHLPERHQQVVALYYAADMTVDEVAGVLSVPAGTVRSDLTRREPRWAPSLENDMTDQPHHPLDDAGVDALARQAGAELRVPAPDGFADGVRRTRRRQQTVRAGLGGAGLAAIIAIGVVTLTGGEADHSVVPATDPTTVTTTNPTTDPTVPTTGPRAIPGIAGPTIPPIGTDADGIPDGIYVPADDGVTTQDVFDPITLERRDTIPASLIPVEPTVVA